jgi:hypothetical protein
MLNVVPMPVNPEQSTRDEILADLRGMIADIESGASDPNYLIYFLGEDTAAGVSYSWDAIGLSYYEMVGHLTTYISILCQRGSGE